MELFQSFDNDISYKDILQLDGAFAVAHINYGKSPIFNGEDSQNLALNSRCNSLSSSKQLDDVLNRMRLFDGTEQNLKEEDQIPLWENFWLEYVNTFNILTDLLPNSVVTVYIGRHAIEIGFKYLLLKANVKLNPTHDLGELADTFFDKCNITDDYMEWVNDFCRNFCRYIEGRNAEYFRYPEYKNNTFFAGNCLDINWMNYNFALILLKLIHYAGIDAAV